MATPTSLELRTGTLAISEIEDAGVMLDIGVKVKSSKKLSIAVASSYHAVTPAGD